MKKDNDNPFSALDKSKFPSKGQSQTFTEKKPALKTIILNTDDEDALFMANMMEVQPMGKKEKYQEKQVKGFTEEEENALFAKAFSKDILMEKVETKPQGKSPEKPEKTEKKADLQFSAPWEQKNSQEKPKIVNNEAYDFFSEMMDVTPLAGKERLAPPEPETFVVQNDPSPLLHDYEDGKIQFSQTITDEYAQCHIIGLDLMTLGQLQNRHYNPESVLDLHGLKTQPAYENLVHFMKAAHYKDMRCVLLITGKGLNSFDNVALLRNKVCDWLTDEPFKHIVLAYCTAKAEDGGSGALYVLLRKRRKNSLPINWERLPKDYDIWSDKV